MAFAIVGGVDVGGCQLGWSTRADVMGDDAVEWVFAVNQRCGEVGSRHARGVESRHGKVDVVEGLLEVSVACDGCVGVASRCSGAEELRVDVACSGSIR